MPEVLEPTEVPEVGSNGNGKLPAELNGFLQTATFEHAFKTQQTSNAIHLLVTLAAERLDYFQKLLMVADLPSQDYATVCVQHYADTVEFEDTKARDQLVNQVAALCSIKGKRAGMLLNAIIGQMQDESRHGGPGWYDRFKNQVKGSKT